MWKTLRIAVLLFLLAIVLFHTVAERRAVVAWRSPLSIGIFPVAGDDSVVTAGYIADLGVADFEPIATFMRREARAHGGPAEPVRIVYYPGPFPALPTRSASDGVLANVWWSLRLRWYAWRRMRSLDLAPPRVRIFVIYHDPARTVMVPHSVGLQKGLVGVVHAFASSTEQGGNQIVIAHEMLHTLGATDKYDAAGMPVYPDGYADPQQQPRLPQRRAEIMAGRRALSAHVAEMPADFAETVLGPVTAREIAWVKP